MGSEDSISDRKSPGFWFYTADYERDMQMLPLEAQGLWMRMLCWASENEIHRGFLELPSGAPMTERDIANRVGKDLRTVQRCLAVMRRIGTFSEDEKFTIFCRRMARDSHISAVRKIAAQKRQLAVERAKDGTFAPPKDPAKVEQTPTVTASASVSDSKQERAPVVLASWQMDLSFAPYVQAWREVSEITGKQLIDEDFSGAWYHWKILSGDQKCQATKAVLDKLRLGYWTGATDPQFIPSPAKFISSGECKRPVVPRKPRSENGNSVYVPPPSDRVPGSPEWIAREKREKDAIRRPHAV